MKSRGIGGSLRRGGVWPDEAQAHLGGHEHGEGPGGAVVPALRSGGGGGGQWPKGAAPIGIQRVAHLEVVKVVELPFQ